MSVRRIMGTETEFGISVPGQPGANPMLTSSQVVNGYAQTQPLARKTRWDFDEEHPLRDARGFDLSREVADSSQLTDEETGLANVILTNGARLYVDHAHPEYSAPECTNPRDVVVWDKAGELVIMEGARQARQIPGAPPLNLYKNNTDNKGASYGSHENYLMRRSTPFASIVRHLTPFFVSRQVVTGAGRVGIGQDGTAHGFQISQRADYFEVEVGLETTLKRPIINTRDEPHANPDRYRRLHVIIGDANLSEISTYLKVGTTSLVLAMIEDGWLTDDLGVDRPVTALHEVSHDPTCTHLMTLKDGRKLTAVQLQTEYLEQARKYVEDKYGDDADRQTKDVLHRWEQVLDQLATDPMKLADQLDWVAKLQTAPVVPRPRRPGLGRLEAPPGRPAVRRPAPGQGSLLQVGEGRPDAAAGHRRGDPDGGLAPADRHPGVLPRPLHAAVRAAGRGRLVGLGDLRPAGQGVAAADPDAGPVAGHESACRGTS